MRRAWARLRRWLRRGSGELIAFAICIVFCIFVFIAVLGIVAHNDALTRLEFAANQAARACVVCADFDEAETVAKETAETVLGVRGIAVIDDVQVNLSLIDGENWEKGRLLDVWVTANVTTLTSITSGPRSAHTVVQVERGTGRRPAASPTPAPEGEAVDAPDT